MSNPMLPNVEDFLVRLRKIDRRGLTAKDVLVLFCIMNNPGCSGIDVSTKLGIKDRSSIASNIHRLERHCFIEDRRKEFRKAVPAILHALTGGVEFWNEIKP